MQDYFRLADAPYQRLLEGIVERMERARAAVDTAERQLSADWSDARARLAELNGFCKAAAENTRQLIVRMRSEWDRRRAPEGAGSGTTPPSS